MKHSVTLDLGHKVELGIDDRYRGEINVIVTQLGEDIA